VLQRIQSAARLAKNRWSPHNLRVRDETLAMAKRKPGEPREGTMRLLKLALAGVCALGLFGLGAARAEPVKIRMSWVAPVANWASIILEKKDLAKHMGKSYTLETIRFRGTPPMITAIANNELEVSNLAYSTLAIAINNASLDDIMVIADEFQDGVPGYFSEQYYVRKDSGINKVEDLKGKVVGTNAAGSAVDIASRAMLRKHGLEDKRDYTIVEGPLPAMPAMLLEKKADLIPAVLPFALNPKLRAGAKVLFEQREALGVTQMIVWTARKSFIDKHRAAMVDFMEDMLIITRWYLDPKNHAEVAKIASKITKAPPERFGWLFTKNDTYRNPDLIPNLEALQRNVDTVMDLGFVKTRVDISKHADLSLVKEALARLKN
jgi:ABC-type nitrate/sulfonate/bicarbonate transport system substrate-binding protein